MQEKQDKRVEFAKNGMLKVETSPQEKKQIWHLNHDLGMANM